MLCVNQRRLLQPLFIGQVPRTSDEGHQLRQKRADLLGTDEMRLGRKLYMTGNEPVHLVF